MKKGITLLVAALFFLLPQAWAIDGKDVYRQYKQHEKKLEKTHNNLVIKMTSSATNGIEMKTVIYTKGPKSRMESTMVKGPEHMMQAGTKTIVIDDGTNTTMFSPAMGRHTSPSEPPGSEDESPQSIDYKGMETVSGIQCHKIVLDFGDEEPITRWIAVKGAYEVQEVINDDEKTRTTYSDFRNVQGLMVPFQTKTYAGQQWIQTATITSVSTEKSLADSLFDPSAVKGYPDKTGMAGSAPNHSQGPSMPGMENLEEMMAIGLQIQQHYQNGEPEKAQALEKKLQQMSQP